MIDLHKEIMERIMEYSYVSDVYPYGCKVVSYHFYDLATDILKLVSDNYISKEVFNNQYKEGKWR